MTFSNNGRPDGRVRVSVVVVLALVAALVVATLVSIRKGSQDEAEPPSVDSSDSPAPAGTPSLDPPAAVRAPAPATAVAAPARSMVKLRFTVAVAPLALETTDRAAALAFQSIYAAFLDELRSTPNLDLVEL